LTEVSFQPNFNIGFSNTRSDVLIHLTQWQYWWWFWFTFLWALYYLLIAKLARFRTLKFRPRLATTTRPRGKWGDLIVCVIPVSWCANILINSNFLLKLIEWQNESSLFTLRIRGRQWYWIYKFDLKNLTDILVTPKNIGRNKWSINFLGDLQTADDYLHILQIRSQNKWIKSYWSDLLSKNSKTKKYNIVSPQEAYKKDLKTTYNNILKNNFFVKNSFFIKFSENSFRLDSSISNLNKNYLVFNSSSLENYFFLNKSKKKFWLANTNEHAISLFDTDENFFKNSFFNLKRKKQVNLKKKMLSVLNNYKEGNYVILNNHSDFNDSSRIFKKGAGTKLPLRVIKYPINSELNNADFYNEDGISLFRFRYNKTNANIEHKLTPHTVFLTVKQKRYRRRKKIDNYTVFFKDRTDENVSKKTRYSGKLFLKNNAIFDENQIDPTQCYRMLKKNKKRYEDIPVVYSKRMLRTQRTLVLPAHVNITAITNSYDVVHSWFIPGLGVKMDCIPGRATHHTFFVDNVGFYYGQCAEVCGRYHHHMPIRICALPFEHFLVWWHSFGLPRLLFTNSQKKFESQYAFRKYVW